MSNAELVGNISHEVQPIIGWLRLCLADGTVLTEQQMEAAVEKLYRALENAQKLV